MAGPEAGGRELCTATSLAVCRHLRLAALLLQGTARLWERGWGPGRVAEPRERGTEEQGLGEDRHSWAKLTSRMPLCFPSRSSSTMWPIRKT